MDSPIISNILDTDYYKWTMSQFIWKYYPDAIAEFELINRTPDYSLLHIDEGELREHLDHAMNLSWNISSLDKETGVFSNLYLMDAAKQKLPRYRLIKTDRLFNLSFVGQWWVVTLWETIAMSIITELYNKRMLPTTTGQKNLRNTINVLKCMPDIQIVDFGTRRRYSKKWQIVVLLRLKGETRNLIGTSNVALSNTFGMPVVGTMAHELFMGVAALYSHSLNSLRGSQQVVLQQWERLYDKKLLTALSDTWGTKFFWEDWTPEQARRWDGVRQDSGNPYTFGSEFQIWHKTKDIPFRDKKVVFSDDLTLRKILILQEQFCNVFQPVFGWGTNLTNNMGLQRPSIVVKLTKLNGISTVKLSDDAGKSQGTSHDLNWYRRAFTGDGIRTRD